MRDGPSLGLIRLAGFDETVAPVAVGGFAIWIDGDRLSKPAIGLGEVPLLVLYVSGE